MTKCLLLSYINLAHAISVYTKSLQKGKIMICCEIIIRKLIKEKKNPAIQLQLPESLTWQNLLVPNKPLLF